MVVKRRVWSVLIVKLEVFLQAPLRIVHAVVGVQIKLFVFDAAPQSFHEHVVTPAALAVHADLDAVVFQHAGEVQAGELTALVGVEDFRLAVTVDCLLYRFLAEVRGQGVGQPPRQHPAGYRR